MKTTKFLTHLLGLFCVWSTLLVTAEDLKQRRDSKTLKSSIFLRDEIGPSTRENRMSLFEPARCTTGEEDGMCYGEVKCKHLKGKPNQFCTGLQGVCCMFHRTCGGRTKQEVSTYRNEKWPYDEKLKETCLFTVVKSAPNICGLSLTLDKLNFPGKVASCTHTFLWITGIPERRIDLICGNFNGQKYDFNITSSTEVFMTVKSYYREFKSSWSISVKQVPCHEFHEEHLPQYNDGKVSSSDSLKKRPPSKPKPTTITTTTTTTPIPTTTTKRPSFSRCGIKGKIIHSNIRQDGSQENDTSTLAEDVVERSGDEEVAAPTYSKLSLTEWAVPQLTDSQFYKVMGKESVLEQRITYGDPTGIGEFPWQAALYVGRSFHCGGSIISNQHILTAAHCVQKYENNPERLRIMLGVWNVRKAFKEKAQSYRIRAINTHKQYSRLTLKHDIAIIKLARKIEFSEIVRPICLATKDMALPGTLATVTGWGRDQRRRLVNVLQKLDAAILSNDICDVRWMAAGARKGFIAPSMMCMDSQQGDSCNGDSGGPTVVENPKVSGQFFQVGIVSFGSGSCTEKKLPGVYSRVSSYSSWIRNNMD